MWSPTRTRIGPLTGETFGELRGGRKSTWRRREGEEERVALCVHLDATVADTRLADQPPVIGKCVGICFSAEFAQE